MKKQADDSQMSVRMQDQLHRCLADFPDADAYLRQMWRLALSESAPESSEHCDALPYLPTTQLDPPPALSPESRLLDIGCLGGYGLFDVARRLGFDSQRCPQLTGIDVSDISIQLARTMARHWAASLHVEFAKCSLEQFEPETPFDIVVCRLVLPYTDVSQSVKRLSGLLKTGGAVLVQLHAPAYYWHQCAGHWKSPKKLAYYLRPLVNSAKLALTKRSWHGRWFNESAISGRQFELLCARNGLSIQQRLGYAYKPLYWCERVNS